jgi:hypothetical protein
VSFLKVSIEVRIEIGDTALAAFDQLGNLVIIMRT